MSEPTAQDNDQYLKEARAEVEEWTNSYVGLLRAVIRGLGRPAEESMVMNQARIESDVTSLRTENARLTAALAAMTERADKLQADATELELNLELGRQQYGVLTAERDKWEVEAKRYCENSDYWRVTSDKLTEQLAAMTEERNAANNGRDFYKDQADVAASKLTRLTAELESKTASYAILEQQSSEWVGILERAIQEAPHTLTCKARDYVGGPINSLCDCWKSRISPDQKPALKGGDAGVFIETPPMTGAADVQSESRPALPDHGKVGEWLPKDHSEFVTRGGAHEHRYKDGGALLSWCPATECTLDEFKRKRGYRPAPPPPCAKQSEEGK